VRVAHAALPAISKRASALVFALALSSAACAHGAVVRGRVEGLEEIVDTAEKNGAKRCAPRELALARAHLHFAATDLDQGELSNAEAHLLVAEPNADAALKNSPVERCADDRVEKPNAAQPRPGDPDTDGDKVPDSRDQCVAEAEDFDGYLDEDGCPEPDNDADGIPDAADKCPNAPEDLDGFEDTDGCPDPDNDKDTVLDVDDMCPNTPGQPGGKKPGCPGLVIVTAHEIRIKEQIHFETNKAVIKSDSFPILDAVRDVLRDNPSIKLEIQGHTDNVGNAPHNMKLSQARADSVRQYVVSHGIEAGRLASKGYGMAQPIVPNISDGNRALNRRVQFIRTEASP
jgi:OmpA-OmpF porin, OOP family